MMAVGLQEPKGREDRAWSPPRKSLHGCGTAWDTSRRVAVFENLIAFMIDEWKLRRPAAALLNGCLIGIFSLPCALGFNLLSGIQPLGKGSTILDFEDYLVSDNLLPLGGLFLILFCMLPAGWGWKNFLAEANSGHGLKIPAWSKYYLAVVLPLLILLLFSVGFWRRWCQ